MRSAAQTLILRASSDVVQRDFRNVQFFHSSANVFVSFFNQQDRYAFHDRVLAAALGIWTHQPGILDQFYLRPARRTHQNLQ